jgi:putative ABC transport system permease protein
MPSIARKNLFEDIPRLLVAQAGIVFAVSLVTIQTGILRGFGQSASLLVDRSTADLWVASDALVHFELTLPIPLETAIVAQGVAGVDYVEPLILRRALWRSRSGQIESVSLMGIDPKATLIQPWQALQTGSITALNTPYRAAVDDSSLAVFGLTGVGDWGSLNANTITVDALTEGAQSIVFAPFVFVSPETAIAYLQAPVETQLNCQLEDMGNLNCTNVLLPKSTDPAAAAAPSLAPPRPLSPVDPITFVLVRAKPDANLGALQKRLQDTLPDTRVFTREELAAVARDYWINRTGVGFVLSLGAIVGVAVGIAIVGQILYASTSTRLREFGTLKAMGASGWVLRGIIIEQSLWMAVLGYVPGMGLCWGVAWWAVATEGIVIVITPLSALLTFGITALMCISASLFAIQKVNRVDPAIVFKA